MLHFFQDLWEYPFLRNAVVAALLAAVAAGVTGSLVVVRRSTYLAGAVSHSVLAGLGAARLLERRFGIGWLPPMAGATLAAVAAALLLVWLTQRGRHRSDTVLSAVWTGGMALGVSCVAATPGYQDDLMSYLFGSILLVSDADLLWMLVADLLLIAVMAVCYNRFLAIAFNADLARLRGVATMPYEVIYYVMTALTVVLLVRVAGILLAVALLTLPAATAGLLTRRLDRMMVVAVGIGAGVSLMGLASSYGPGWPPGATIVEFAIVAYLIAAAVKKLVKKKCSCT
jgi:zinc transport system permease protein